MSDAILKGCRLLILEDDFYQAQDCRHLLEDAGAEIVAMTASVPDLDALLALGRINAALLDINLGRGCSLEFARLLRERGVPFVFLTGYDAEILPDDLADTPCLCKPAEAARLIAELRMTVSGGG